MNKKEKKIVQKFYDSLEYQDNFNNIANKIDYSQKTHKKKYNFKILSTALACVIIVGAIMPFTIDYFNKKYKNPTAQPTVEPSVEVMPSNEIGGSEDLSNETSLPPTTSQSPSAQPTITPTQEPSTEPTVEPFPQPSTEPTVEPFPQPSTEPTPEPTLRPSAEPTVEPTVEAPNDTTQNPSDEPFEPGLSQTITIDDKTYLLIEYDFDSNKEDILENEEYQIIDDYIVFLNLKLAYNEELDIWYKLEEC